MTDKHFAWACAVAIVVGAAGMLAACLVVPWVQSGLREDMNDWHAQVVRQALDEVEQQREEDVWKNVK